jgi:hypothetical protein
MYLPVTAPTFMRVLLLWFMLHLNATSASGTTLQKRGQPGRVAPAAGVQIAAGLSPVSPAAKIYPARVLRAVLKDQLNVVPEKGKVYVFATYIDGTTLQNFCNGGRHNTIVIAKFGDENTDFKEAQAEMHHLDFDCNGNTVHLVNPFDYDDAYLAVSKNNRFKCLGKSKLKGDYKQVTKTINDESKSCFRNTHALK